MFDNLLYVYYHLLSSCRYFVLDPEVGQLQYHLNELGKSQRPARGSLPLLGAMVVSCAEHPYMFTIQATTGDAYKLRGKTTGPSVFGGRGFSLIRLGNKRRTLSSGKQHVNKGLQLCSLMDGRAPCDTQDALLASVSVACGVTADAALQDPGPFVWRVECDVSTI